MRKPNSTGGAPVTGRTAGGHEIHFLYATTARDAQRLGRTSDAGQDLRGLSINTDRVSTGPQERHFSYLGPVKSGFLAVGLLLVLVPTQADEPLGPRSKGRLDAPVTVYEMADFQCPACRMFAVTVLPALDREYIQTGKVRWVFINLPLTSIHPNAVAAAEVAMCAGRQGRFWPTHDALYKQQDDWAKLANPTATLVALAQRAGSDKAKLLACITEGHTRQEIELDAQRAARSGAHATPSFYIEGGLMQGAPYTPDPMRHLLDSIYTVRTRARPRSSQ
jgi:protein-disulfide isomerase